MNELQALLKILTPVQLDFVRVRLQAASDAEAARDVGVAAGTVSRWKAEGVPIDEIVQLAKMDSIEVARENLRRLAAEAVEALRAELHGTRRRLDAAREVLDRVGLEASKKVSVNVTNDDIDAEIEAELARLSAERQAADAAAGAATEPGGGGA